MHTLLILSRDAAQYRDLILSADLANLRISQSVNHIDKVDFSIAHTILLGEPDLCAQALPKLPQIKWVQSTWAGVKPIIDIDATHFTLTAIKGLFGKQMQQYVFAYLLYFSRQIQEFQSLQRQHRWNPIYPQGLDDKRIGILGLGSIGIEVAKTAKHFNMQVIGVTRTGQSNADVDELYSISQAKEFAPSLDFLVSLLPHTQETEHIINANFLSLLPNHCVFISAGRGQVVDENALCAALNNGQLKAAVLDVFENEPLSKDHPFWRLDNVWLTQHTAAISRPAEIAGIFIDNYQRYHQHLPLENIINRSKGY
jgi:phosphoglycerate dehydrogenase-like enzyme